MTRTVVKNIGKEPVEVTLEVNGQQQRAIINKGRIELPLGAKLVSEHPNIKIVENKSQVKEPEKIVVKNSTPGNTTQKVS